MEGNFSQFVKQFRGDFKVFKQNVSAGWDK